MASLRWLTLCALLAATASCGDPVVDETFRGQPLVTLEGESRGDSPDLELGSTYVRLGLFWSQKGTAGSSIDEFYEQRSASVATMIPQSWTLNIFDAPPNEVLTTMKGATASFAVGRLFAYKDVNLSGRRDSDEPLLGVDSGRLVLYAPQAINAAASPTGLDLPAGFYVISSKLACQPVTLMQPNGDRDCNVPIGRECMNNSECGEGTCLHEYIVPWIKGVCAVSNPTPQSCRPKNGALIKDPAEGGPDSTGGYWVQACEATSDCGRPLPYACDQGKKACMATGYIRVEINAEVTIPGFCATQSGPQH